MATLITPFTYFADPVKNRPVSNGFVYIGRPNTDPTDPDNQIPITQVCPCDGTEERIPVEQPFRTGDGGVPIINGIPAHIDISTDFFSILLQDKNGTEVYRSPSAGQFGPERSFLRISNNLSDLDDTAAARTNLELGTAAVQDVGTGDGDVMEVGAFGLGRQASNISDLNLQLSDRETILNIYGTTAQNKPSSSSGTLLTITRNRTTDSSISKSQLAIDSDQNLFFRILSNNSYTDWQQALTASSNLSDLSNAATARTNLGLGTTATLDTGTAGGELRTNTQNDGQFYPRSIANSRFLQVTNNLSDLGDAAAARTNLELGTAAVQDVGTGDGDVMEVGAFGLGRQASNISDLNLQLSDRETILNIYGTTAQNKPSSSSGTLLTITRNRTTDSSISKSQLAIDSDQNLFFRILSNNSYTDWQQALTASSNLSDLSNAATARTNLGLGTTATLDTGTAGGELRTNTQNDGQFYPRSIANSRFLQVTNNLSDLGDAAAARTNLELGTAAVQDVGTGDGDVMEVGAFGLGRQASNISDLNLQLSDRETILNIYGTTAQNKPSSSSGTLLTITRNRTTDSSISKSQLAIDSDQNLFFRILSNNSYTDWQQALTASSNLSDLSNAATARTNLGLGTTATLDTGTAGGELRTNTQNDGQFYPRSIANSRFLQVTNNLSDLGDAAAARTNLELGTAAVQDVGTGDGDVMEVGAFGLGRQASNISDLNLQLSDRETILNIYGTTAQNKPSSSSGTLLTITRNRTTDSSISKSQLAIDSDQNLFFRILSNNSYTDWQQALTASSNLSDLSNAATARTNLGLGTTATLDTGTAGGELRTNTQNDGQFYPRSIANSRFLQVTNNLSDLGDAAAARTNLELGTAAVQDVGTGDGDVMEVGAFGLGRQASNISDLNLQLSDRETILNIYGTTAQNKPSSSSGTLLTITRNRTTDSSISKSQLAIDSGQNLFFRILSNNSYTDWQQALTTSSNLSDLSNAATARTNLGIGNLLSSINNLDGTGLTRTLPAGGMWMYWIRGINADGQLQGSSSVGISEGGSSVVAGSGTSTIGFAFRVS